MESFQTECIATPVQRISVAILEDQQKELSLLERNIIELCDVCHRIFGESPDIEQYNKTPTNSFISEEVNIINELRLHNSILTEVTKKLKTF